MTKSKKKTDSNHIFYYSQTLEEILDMQLDSSMQEIGFAMVFKAAYIYHKGKIPTNKLCQFCRVFEKQEIFVNFIEKNYEKKSKFYYSKSYQKEVNLILKNSKSARDSVLKRWNNEDTNEDTNVIRSLYKTSNTNNNVNSSSVSSVNNLLKEKENSIKNNFNIFWQNYTPIKTLDKKVTSKGSRQTALSSYKKAITKHTPEVISDGLERYLKHCQANSILTCGATVFLNQERYLNDETVFVKAANRSPPKETTAETYHSLLKKYENENAN